MLLALHQYMLKYYGLNNNKYLDKPSWEDLQLYSPKLNKKLLFQLNKDLLGYRQKKINFF